MNTNSRICGVILAGGRASRMGYVDKPLVKLGGKPLLEYILERARPQVDQLLISVNRHPERFAPYRLPCVADSEKARAGPLAGIYSAMAWYARHGVSVGASPADRASRTTGIATNGYPATNEHPGLPSPELPADLEKAPLLACFPGDVPIFPNDLVSRLSELIRSERVPLVMVRSGQQLQPLFSVWSFQLLPALEGFLRQGLKGPKQLLPVVRHGVLQIDPARCEPASFFNINCPEDLASVKSLGKFSESN